MRNAYLALIVFVFMPVTAWAVDMYSVNSGATVQINEHGVCQRITNSHASGRPIMVPTRTASEWTTFRNNRPAGVGMTACVQNCVLPWGGTIAHGQSVTAYSAATVGCEMACQSQTRTCNNGILSGSYSFSSCNIQSGCGYYIGLSPYNQNTLSPCNANAVVTTNQRCSPIGKSCWAVQSGGDFNGATLAYTCSETPKVLCGFFNSIGLLPDNIYQADVRYAQLHVSPEVNRGYRLWAEPITGYLRRNPDSILVPILRPFVVGWAEEMAYRMGEIDQSNRIGRILIAIGTPVSTAIAWTTDLYDYVTHRYFNSIDSDKGRHPPSMKDI